MEGKGGKSLKTDYGNGDLVASQLIPASTRVVFKTGLPRLIFASHFERIYIHIYIYICVRQHI